MGKGHRDNHAARVKRGPAAFAKKATRRGLWLVDTRCPVCGRSCRPVVLARHAGTCGRCA